MNHESSLNLKQDMIRLILNSLPEGERLPDCNNFEMLNELLAQIVEPAPESERGEVVEVCDPIQMESAELLLGRRA